MTIVTGFGAEPQYVDDLLRDFQGRLPDAREFALEKRVLLLRSRAGIPVDVALGALPFEDRVVQRASPYRINESVALTTCGAEDLVVLKVFAGREKDWLDVEGIALRQGSKLDRTLVWRELKPLLGLKEDVAAEPRLARLFASD